MTRAAQMATQYYWLYERTEPSDLARPRAGRGNSGRKPPIDPVTPRQKPDKMTPIQIIAAGATMRSEVRNLRRTV